MDRIKNIIENKEYIKCIKKNKKSERHRPYCKHGFDHFIDTARIAYIINLEKGLKLEKEMIYAAALLHDIGKWKQYTAGVPHEIASCVIAKEILEASGFSDLETECILDAIEGHRIKDDTVTNLKELLALADKLSRNCFYCKAKEHCNWTEEKKNKSIYF